MVALAPWPRSRFLPPAAGTGAAIYLPRLTPKERQPALPHRGNGQGGGDGEDKASETLNLGKVQGLCRFPQGRRRAVRGGAGHPSAETATPYRRGKKGVVWCCRGLTTPSPILQRVRAGYWRRRSRKKRLELGRLSWRFRSFASPSSISMGQRVPRAPPLLQPSNPSPARRRRVGLC